MQRRQSTIALLASVVWGLIACHECAAVTPIGKVLEMIQGMITKGKQEKHEESVRFSSFKTWCEETTAEMTRSIKAGADAAAQLEADIATAQADADRAAEDISDLNANLEGWNAEKTSATALRAKERKDFDAVHKDYSESIDALGRAIETLKRRSKDVPQSKKGKDESLVAVSKMPRIPASAQKALAQFLQQDPSVPDAYDFQSSSIVDMLEKLKTEFVKELRQAEKEELNRKHSFGLVNQRLTDDIGAAENTRDQKVQFKSQRLGDRAQASGDLTDTLQAKKEDETYHGDTVGLCRQTSSDFESRQALRAQELDALQQAHDIISSDSVSGAGAKHLPAALQLASRQATAFALLRVSPSKSIPAAQLKAMTFLTKSAEKTDSMLLRSLASHAGSDPFVKVRQMITDLLAKLKEEAANEADHKQWCDEEMSTNKASRDQMTKEVADLTSTVDEQGALASKLAQEISDLNDEIAEINAALAEATKNRAEDKAKNAETVTEAKAAQEAVSRAISVLKEFYGSAADATALSQLASAQPRSAASDSPFVFKGAYKGMQSESGGIVGMLDVVKSDFARLEAETTTSEDSAQEKYDQFSEESTKNVATKDKEARHKGFAKTRAETALHRAEKDLKATQGELDAANSYHEKLQDSCVKSKATYEGRVSNREQEIQDLKEALRILEGEV